MREQHEKRIDEVLQGAPSRLHPFTVVTYNIHYCIGTDRRFSPARIARIIKLLGADIIALQEVGWHYRGRADFDQFEYLRQKTGYAVHAGLTRSHEAAHFGNALLTRTPVRNLRLMDLSVAFRAPRGAIDADVEIDGRKLRVINVHLGLDPWERRSQVAQIVDALGPPGDQPTLLMGDFNDWRVQAPAFAPLKAHFPHVAAPPSFHTRRPLLRYDRLYASPGFRVLDSHIVQNRLARRASDHMPVLGRLIEESAPAGMPGSN